MTTPQQPCPCEGQDPFCEHCIPFGRHLDADVQRRRREYHAQQGRRRPLAEAAAPRGPLVAVEDTFIHELAQRRNAAGFTQSALAATVGISRRALCAIEAGTVPRQGVLAKLRVALAGVGADAGAPQKRR